MQQTANFALPTWEKNDPIRMTDFNAMTAALDTAIAGRCHAEVGSYTGTGVSGPNNDPSALTFSQRPLAVIFPYGHGDRLVLNIEDEQVFYPDGSYSTIIYQWEGNTLKWYADVLGDQSVVSRYQMNIEGKVYPYLALYQA